MMALKGAPVVAHLVELLPHRGHVSQGPCPPFLESYRKQGQYVRFDRHINSFEITTNLEGNL